MKLEQLKKLLPNNVQEDVLTIHEIETKELDGSFLPEDEEKALDAFRKYRLKKLQGSVKKENKFHENYALLRAASHFVDYRNFLEIKI
jgi:hypothetical protein